MQYPSKEDYVRSVQHRESFTCDELRRAEFELHPVWQIPKPAAGTSAVVFKAVLDGEEQALRFFTRDEAASGERYAALQDHFTGRDLVSCVAMSRWIDDGIRINDRTWPVLRMQWVNGRTLNQHVEQLVEQRNTAELDRLAGAWRELVTRLQTAEFAHGDLQHGNVLVDDRGALRLVDFDCSWIARFSGQPAPSETGHRNYQPDNRPWGQWMDTFPGLVIYTSLLALSKNPTPWRALNTGENLLFQREDFGPPFDTPAWTHVSRIGDPQLDQLAARLRECCAPGWSPSGGLHELLAPRELPWWERIDKTTAGQPSAGQPSVDPPPSISPPQRAPQRTPSGERTMPWWEDTRIRNAPAPLPPQGPVRPRAGREIGFALGTGLVAWLVAAIAGQAAAGLIIGLLAGFVVFIVVRVTRT